MSSSAVYQDRIARTQAALAREGIDLLVVGPGSDLIYLTGIDAHLSERLNLLMVPARGKPSYVVPRLEAPNMADKADLVEFAVWDETDSPSDLAGSLAEGVRRVAVGDQLHAAFLIRLQNAIP
ncbi:MAG: aminopeptidase P family N-terminal domain-containing protein, partial [Chloroflexota bacterium]|nr:aminopeptidase P family N-terminal domain-containing protein [Chloroflexota bacterium]